MILHQWSSYQTIDRKCVHDEFPDLRECLVLIDQVPLLEGVVPFLAIKPILIIEVIVVHHSHLDIRFV
jgi:hypothetical protein